MMFQQWVNLEDDGAPWALLRRIPATLPVDTIDGVWLFPTRRAAGFESTVVVVTCFQPDSLERRRVCAFRFLVTRDRKARASVDEHRFDFAIAPADAIPRVVEGVRKRLGDSADGEPREAAIEGDADRWQQLLRELGEPEPRTPPDVDSTADHAGDPPHDAAVAGAPAAPGVHGS